MRFTLLLLLFPFLCHGQVQVAGNMRKIMQLADLAPAIDLDTLTKSNLYGLGVVGGLKGEIIIINGKPFVTSVDNDGLQTITTTKVKAAMLVYDRIRSWKKLGYTRPFESLHELEVYLDSLVLQELALKNKPFAFIIKAKKGTINYHVIEWRTGTEHTPASHKQFAKDGEIHNNEAVILGFYSDHHQGVFTHHDSNLHLHVLSNDPETVGHVDRLQLQEYELLIPGLQ